MCSGSLTSHHLDPEVIRRRRCRDRVATVEPGHDNREYCNPMAAEHGHSPLSHVVDHPTLELPYWSAPYGWEIHLPTLGGVQLTRFMVTELIAAVLMLLILPSIARHVGRESVTRGWFNNMFEAMILFVRDQ